MKKPFSTSLLLTLCFLLFADTTHAFSLGDAFKLNPDTTVKSTFPDFGTIISTILPNVYIISGVILLFLLIFGGITVIGSGGNPEQTQKGQQAITGAIIGFIVIFTSYWIVQIIEIITGISILNANILGT